MAKPLCIYHGNCFDGFTAAWAVWKRFGDGADYLAANYGDAPPDVTGRDVIIVDFSYKRDVLARMISEANTLLLLDHHKTAEADLSGQPAPRATWEEHLAYAGAPGCETYGIQFDMERSGAGLAWDYFHPGEARPRFLAHTEDRDLWRFAMKGTREVHAAMSSRAFSFEDWEEIYYEPVSDLIREGAAIDRKHLRDIATLVGAHAYRMTIGGHDVPVCNLPVTMCSDAGNKMCAGEPFAATYYDTATHRNYSLRSTDAGLDVSEIAKQYGGGGHRNASGFRLPHGVTP